MTLSQEGAVLDASSMLALLRDEPGADAVEEALRSGHCAAHAVNLCEVFYRIYRTEGEDGAQAAMEALRNDGVIPYADLDDDLWQAAARVKSAHHRRVSLADALGMSLAARLSRDFLTADRFELEPLAPSLPARLRFIR